MPYSTVPGSQLPYRWHKTDVIHWFWPLFFIIFSGRRHLTPRDSFSNSSSIAGLPTECREFLEKIGLKI